jgi:hypothetical protein
MYKHANKVYAERRKYSQAQARHVVSMSRIKANVRRMGDMIQIIEPPTHDLISLPPIKGTGDDDDDDDEAIERARQQLVYNALSKSRSGSRRMSNIGYSKSNVKELNKEKVIALMQRIHDAESSSVPDWELKQYDSSKPRERKKTLRRSHTAAEIETSVLEKKLGAAIRSSYRTLDTGGEKKILSTRILLPFYKMADVKHFLDIFQKVDEDYSGTILL